jgi:hypothetical protein
VIADELDMFVCTTELGFAVTSMISKGIVPDTETVEPDAMTATPGMIMHNAIKIKPQAL